MGATSTVLWLLLPLAMQWLLVAANPTRAPPTTSKGVAADSTTTTTTDRVTASPSTTNTTSEPDPLSTARDSLAAGTGGVVAARDGGIARPSTLDESPTTATAGPTTTKRRAQPFCPAGCECEHLEVHCSRAGLVAFPEGVDPRTTYLDVGNNRLTAIADDELDGLGLGKLTSLICDDNLIETIGPYAFRGLRNLALLQLSGNRIRRLPPFVFVGNRDLRHIDLTGNPLELERGPILSIQQLEWMDMDHCNISHLSLDAFRDMRGLRYLNLSGNRISRLTLDHFAGLNYLRYIKLNGNPLVCDCNMKPVWEWFRHQTVLVDAKCISPLNGSTQSWNYLELLTCKNQSRHEPLCYRNL